MRHQKTLVLQLSASALAMAQSFNMWPIIDAASLAKALDVSQACVDAL
jgi:hypothetical protein